MIARYTDHAANERTFLAWIRTGLTVVAFGLFLVKLNIAVDAAGGDTLPRLAAEDAGALVAAAARYGGLVMVVIGVAIIARSSAGFERTRRAIDSDEVIRMPRSCMQLLLSTVIAIGVVFFCIYLAML
jgi:putative membrane protein